MLRSMYAGVSGLKAHMNKMDVIGNNIANVNTTGYKSSRATFKSMLSQTIQGASAPQEGRGGMNPQQIGLGVTLGSIDRNMEQGNLQSTGRNTDLAIQGNGFFIMESGTGPVYTRAGTTTFDRDGYLVSSTNGYRVQGWNANDDQTIDVNGDLEDITLKQSMVAKATNNITYSGNLNSEAYDENVDYGDVAADGTPAGAPGVTPPVKATHPNAYEVYENNSKTRNTTISVYDSQGGRHSVDLTFEKTGENTWSYTVNSVSGADNITGDTGGELVFDSNGDVDLDASNIIPLGFDPAGGAAVGQEIELDFSAMTQTAGAMSADIDTITGYQAGTLQKFAIDASGTITGFYDNGMRQTVGRVGLATFNNPAGLAEEGNTMFATSNNSGQAKIGAPGDGGIGALAAGTLEMSNVDLSAEFTEMITTQRGFQANSKTISTGDQILEQLVNLKR